MELSQIKAGDKVKGGCNAEEVKEVHLGLRDGTKSGELWAWHSTGSCNCWKDWILVESNNSLTPSLMTNLISSLRSLIRTEPEKSFVETGVTDEHDVFTKEGTDLFIDFLKKEFKQKFYEDYVKPLAEKLRADKK